MIQVIYFVAAIIAIFQFALMIKLWVMCDDIKSIKNKLLPEEKKETISQEMRPTGEYKELNEETISDDKLLILVGVIFGGILLMAAICKFA